LEEIIKVLEDENEDEYQAVNFEATPEN